MAWCHRLQPSTTGISWGSIRVGTGPFKFVKWDENADIKVERNPDYAWAPEIVTNTGAPYLDGIDFKIVPEEATRIGSVQSKQVLAAETVPPQNILTLKKDPNFQLLQANTLGLPYTLFFNQERAPWNELKAKAGGAAGRGRGRHRQNAVPGHVRAGFGLADPGHLRL
ncbi:ABC transporter substrate-binding protein [Paenibacillus sp. JTLBN-2024]